MLKDQQTPKMEGQREEGMAIYFRVIDTLYVFMQSFYPAGLDVHSDDGPNQFLSLRPTCIDPLFRGKVESRSSIVPFLHSPTTERRKEKEKMSKLNLNACVYDTNENEKKKTKN